MVMLHMNFITLMDLLTRHAKQIKRPNPPQIAQPMAEVGHFVEGLGQTL